MLDPEDLETTFAPGRNFANKLWNIGQFALAQLGTKVPDIANVDRAWFTNDDKWILTRAQQTIQQVTASFEQFRLDDGARTCFDFVWKDLADWYIESVKVRLGAGAEPQRWSFPQSGIVAQSVLAWCFDIALRLLHPVVPFITEELWSKLPSRTKDKLLADAAWPKANPHFDFSEDLKRFGIVPEFVGKLRTIRADHNIPPGKAIGPVFFTSSEDSREIIIASGSTIQRLANVTELKPGHPSPDIGPTAQFVLQDATQGFVPLGGVVDTEIECARLKKEQDRLDTQLATLSGRLANENFVSRAPADVVAREREKEKTWREQRDVLASKLRALGCV
jgi:valyl-tRNA synthetase